MSSPIRKIETQSGTRYRVVVDVGRKPDGRRAQRTRTFGRRKEAVQWLAEVRSSVDRGSYVAPTRVTVSEFLDGWLGGRRGLRPGTVRAYRDALHPVRDRLGGWQLQRVTRSDIEAVVSAMLTGETRRIGRKGEPLSPRTCNAMLTVLRGALDSAVRDGLMVRNPAEYVERVPQPRAERPTWTAEQVRTFLAHADTDRWAASWRLSLLGLRRGEVLGLRWEDVDLDAGTLSICQARTAVGGREEVGAPKSARSRRVLPLDTDTVVALRAQRKRQAEQRLAAGAAYEASGYVVVDELGRPPYPKAYSVTFARLAVDAGLPPIRLHDARHTALSLMALNGVPIAVVSAWAGHASPSFTASVYLHSQDGALAEAGRTLGELLGGVVSGDV